MAAADYDPAYRSYAAPAPAPVGEYDRPYRNEVVPYGDRRLDVVVKSPAMSPPPLPASTRSGAGGGGGVASAWCFSDPEMKRRRRVASYKAYSVEGKVKSSLRRGFRWIKAKCSELIHGCQAFMYLYDRDMIDQLDHWNRPTARSLAVAVTLVALIRVRV